MDAITKGMIKMRCRGTWQEIESIKQQEEINKFQQGFSYKPPDPTYLYHAISSPLDYYNDYRPIFMMGADLYKQEMAEHSFDMVNAKEVMQAFTRLLYKVIEHFSKEFKWPRGEPIYYRLQEVGGLEGHWPVIVFKECNNGTMHAFSMSQEALTKLPHDFDCEWELEDRIQIKD